MAGQTVSREPLNAAARDRFGTKPIPMGLPSSFTQLYGTILAHSELLSCLCSTPFFFVSTAITGCPAAWNAFTVALIAELSVTVRVVGTFARLAVGLQAEVEARQQ